MKYILTIEAEFEAEDYTEAMGTALEAALNVKSIEGMAVKSVVHKPQPAMKPNQFTINNGGVWTDVIGAASNLLNVGHAE